MSQPVETIDQWYTLLESTAEKINNHINDLKEKLVNLSDNNTNDNTNDNNHTDNEDTKRLKSEIEKQTETLRQYNYYLECRKSNEVV